MLLVPRAGGPGGTRNTLAVPEVRPSSCQAGPVRRRKAVFAPTGPVLAGAVASGGDGAQAGVSWAVRKGPVWDRLQPQQRPGRYIC